MLTRACLKCHAGLLVGRGAGPTREPGRALAVAPRDRRALTPLMVGLLPLVVALSVRATTVRGVLMFLAAASLVYGVSVLGRHRR